MPAIQYTSLAAALAAVPDPRAARGQRYPWPLLLLLVAAALLNGQSTVRAMADWLRWHAADLRAVLPAPPARWPSAATLYRTLRHLDVAALEAILATYAAALLPPLAPPPPLPCAVAPAPLRGLALDGKTVRGALTQGHPCHLVSLVDHTQALVLRQLGVPAKTNEITAAPRLLRGCALRHCVITMDALLTQRRLARQIRNAHGHYLMVLKDNHPRLAAAGRALFESAAAGPTYSRSVPQVSKGHGRLETRWVECSTRLLDHLDWPGVVVPEYLNWPDVAQVVRRTCERVVSKTGVRSVSVEYALTSLSAADADATELERLWRGHWTIENRVHYVRDVTLGEDAGQIHTGNAPQALAALRNGILNLLRARGYTNIAAALREYAASVAKTFHLLTTPRL